MKELREADKRAREIALHGPNGAKVIPTPEEALQEAYEAAERAGRTDLMDKMVASLNEIFSDAIETEKRYGSRP